MSNIKDFSRIMTILVSDMFQLPKSAGGMDKTNYQMKQLVTLRNMECIGHKLLEEWAGEFVKSQRLAEIMDAESILASFVSTNFHSTNAQDPNSFLSIR